MSDRILIHWLFSMLGVVLWLAVLWAIGTEQDAIIRIAGWGVLMTTGWVLLIGVVLWRKS